MKTTEETIGMIVNQITAPITRELEIDVATMLSLDNPIFYENVASEVWEKCNTDHVSIAKLLRNGFVTVEQITDMSDGGIPISSYEEIAIPYGVLPTETMAEIIGEVKRKMYESY